MKITTHVHVLSRNTVFVPNPIVHRDVKASTKDEHPVMDPTDSQHNFPHHEAHELRQI